MYVPKAFRETRVERLHRVIREHGFGLLVTVADDRPFATHLPMLLDADRGPWGTLRGHIARDNPQGRSFDSEAESLAVFQGPHAYVSPRWYASAPNVPTWNYIAVHAYGPVRRSDDPAALDRLLEDLIAVHESGRARPWSRSELPADFYARMRHGIVGFEIEITRLEGKFKLSQNRRPEDRAAAAAALAQGDDPLARAVARLMAEQQAETAATAEPG